MPQTQSNSLDWNPPKGKGGRKHCNPLLVRTELAKVKPTTYDLPASGHTYGRAQQRDAEDASAVTMSWKEHQPNPDQVPGCDFRSLNRQAVIEGNFTAKTQKSYRTEHQSQEEFRLKQGHVASAGVAALPSDGNTDYMYGQASRPSTPIEFLMTNSYLRSFVEDQKHTYDLAGGATEAKVRTAVRTTKATMARDETIKQALEYVEQESSWKMNKFSHVSAKVGTRS